MKKSNTGTEIKVGIFVLIALALLTYMSLKLGEESITTKKTYPVEAIFDDVSGLVEGARVEMAGVEIGRVADISLADNGKARVRMNIYEGVKIAKDAVAMVRTKGVLGDRYVEIRQGKSPEYIPPGGMIARTVSPVDLDEILAEVGPALQDIRHITATLREVLASDTGKKNLREMIANLSKAAAAFKQVGDMLVQGKGTLGKLLTDETLYKRLDSLSINMNEASINLNKIFKKLNSNQGTLGRLINDEELYNEIKTAFKNISHATSTLDELIQRVEKGEGTLGKLLSDDELYENLSQTVASLRKITEKIEKGEGTLGKLINDDELYFEAKKTLQSVNQAASGVQEQMPVTILGTIGGLVLQ
ncbi:MAG: MCE family protein [Thermodesulfobacteria bacterium]|nr:MCE family protein [Thermodesulfobacteriota bacterium]